MSCWKCHGSGEIKLSKALRKKLNSASPSQTLYRPCPVCVVKPVKPINQRTSNKQLSVCIVGGGIGGLALGVMLQRLGIEFDIYEKDKSFACRRQGYGLTLQQGSNVLQKLGVTAYGVSSKSHYVFDHKGNIISFFGRVFSPSTSRRESQKTKVRRMNLHIPRQHLRRLLLENVSPKHVLFGQTIKSVRNNPETKSCSIISSNNEERAYQLVVGADGIYSQIRDFYDGPIVSSSLNYLGVMVVLGISLLAPPLYRERVIQSSNGQVRFYAMPFTGDNSIPPQRTSSDSVPNERVNRPDDLKPEINARIASEIRKNYLQGQFETTMWQLSFQIKETELEEYLNKLGMGTEKNLTQKEIALRLKNESLAVCKTFHKSVLQLIHGTPLELISGHPAFDRDIAIDESSRIPAGFRETKKRTNPCGESPFACQDQVGHLQPSAKQKKVKSNEYLPDCPQECEGVIAAEVDEVDLQDSSTRSPITLIGDSVHPMSPFKGQGANQAMVDAVELAEHIQQLYIMGSTALEDVLCTFEQSMVKRTTPKVNASRNAIAPLHSPSIIEPPPAIQSITSTLAKLGVHAECEGSIDERLIEALESVGASDALKGALSKVQSNRSYSVQE